MMASKYLEFCKQAPFKQRITDAYTIMSKTQKSHLGNVAWYGPRRQYCFYPSPNCVFNQGCMTDIVSFMKTLMDERSKRKEAICSEKRNESGR